jgi:hypothetical protein
MRAIALDEKTQSYPDASIGVLERIQMPRAFELDFEFFLNDYTILPTLTQSVKVFSE